MSPPVLRRLSASGHNWQGWHSRRRGADGERGAVAVLMLGVCAAALAVGMLVVVAATEFMAAALQAQAAADAAALAAADATPLGSAPGSPRSAALLVARRHGAHLTRCCGDVGALPPLVRVTVTVAPRGLLGAVAPPVQARAAASLRPSGRASAARSAR